MTLLVMQYSIMTVLVCVLITGTLAAADEPVTAPSDPAPAPCSTVRTAMNVTDCPWEQFSELRSGATIDFPPGLFMRAPISATSVNEVLVSDQGKMVVSVWSASTNTQLSPREALATDLYNSGLTSVIRQDAGEAGYTFAGTLGLRALLKRRMFSTSTPVVATTVCVTWPSDATDDWSQLAAMISRSLKSDNGRVSTKVQPGLRPEDKIATCLGL